MRISALLMVIIAGGASLVAFPNEPSLMSWDEYLRVSRHIVPPYVVNIETTHEHLVYFGVAHMFDPSAPQFAALEKSWWQFEPDLAFTEGDNVPTPATTRHESITHLGELGLVTFLAAHDRVPVSSMDAQPELEIAQLTKRYSPEQIKVYFLLRQSTFAAHFQKETIDEQIQGEIANLARHGFTAPPNSPEELQSAFQRYFPALHDYKEASYDWFDPTRSGTAFNDMTRSLNAIRDRHMISMIVQQVKKGRRVFAVAGFSHIVMQEAILRAELTSRP